MNLPSNEELQEIAKHERWVSARWRVIELENKIKEINEELSGLQKDYIEADFKFKLANKDLYGEYE